MDNIQIRKLDNNVNLVSNSRTIEGYALKFNQLSENLGGYYERLDPRCLDGVIERSDVAALLDHDPSKGILGRSKFGKGSLTLTIDEIGLKYSFEAPKNDLGDTVIEYLTRGDIDSSSFAFVYDKTEKSFENGKEIITVLKIRKLLDISCVYCPAYPNTSAVYKRYLENKLNDEDVTVDEQVNEVPPVEEIKPIEDEVKPVDKVTEPIELVNETLPEEEIKPDETVDEVLPVEEIKPIEPTEQRNLNELIQNELIENKENNIKIKQRKKKSINRR
jgi:uncharacterized protein